MNTPSNVTYTKSHEWVQELGEGKIRVGISDYAQSQLGNIVFVNLPEKGDAVVAGEAFMDLESVKAVSDLYSPASGTITAINESLFGAPEAINDDAYTAWIVELSEVTGYSELLTAEEYDAFCQTLED